MGKINESSKILHVQSNISCQTKLLHTTLTNIHNTLNLRPLINRTNTASLEVVTSNSVLKLHENLSLILRDDKGDV